MEEELNKTVCKFQYKKRKYEIDCLLDSEEHNVIDEKGNGVFAFHIFDVTDGLEADGGSLYVAAFKTLKGADYKKLAKEALKKELKNGK